MPDSSNITRHIYTKHVRFHHNVTTQQSESYHIHAHEFYEAYFFISGQVDYIVDGIEYHPQPYSLILIGADVPHGYWIRTDMPYERYSFHFLPELLTGRNREAFLSAFQPTAPYLDRLSGFHLESYFESVIACTQMDTELQSLSLPVRMESLLSQILYIRRRNDASPPNPKEKGYSPMNLITYIHDHIREPLTLDYLSSLFLVGKNQLNRIFREATGTTIIRYINQRRSAIAMQSILRGLSPAEAAQDAGFQDYSTFFRAYKACYHISPSQTGSVPSEKLGL